MSVAVHKIGTNNGSVCGQTRDGLNNVTDKWDETTCKNCKRVGFPVVPTERRCANCRVKKPISEFYKGGYNCKGDCANEAARGYAARRSKRKMAERWAKLRGDENGKGNDQRRV